MSAKVTGYPKVGDEINWTYWKEPYRQWWPWLVAIAYYERKTGLRISKEHLMKMGRRGFFRFGKTRANCPSRLAPVDRFTFEPWVDGNGKAPRK